MTYEEKVFTGREWDVTLFGPHGGWLWKYSIWEPYERYDTLIERSQVVARKRIFSPHRLRAHPKNWSIRSGEKSGQRTRQKRK